MPLAKREYKMRRRSLGNVRAPIQFVSRHFFYHHHAFKVLKESEWKTHRVERVSWRKTSKSGSDKNDRRSPRKNPGNSKDQFPRGDSTNLPNTSSQNNTPYNEASWSYDQTAATQNSAYSKYQAVSLSGLPSARVWPGRETVPSQTRLDHDLLGLSQELRMVTYSAYSPSIYLAKSLECPYHRTVHQIHRTGLGEEGSGYGRSGLDRFLFEAPSEQGTVYCGEKALHRADGCCCLGLP
jgi:hypothetical protein